MTKKYLFAFIFLPLFLAQTTVAQNAELSQGSQLLTPFKMNLQAALASGLSRSVVEAIGVCQIQAPDIADSLSLEGVIVGRSSHRLRNPGNAAPEWVEPIMDSYTENSSNAAPQVVALPGDRLGYVEPIVLQPMCTACHGDALDTDVARRISELYPQDQAVGFSAGDLRGVFWVEFPVEE